MINLKTHFVAICIALLFSTNVKAQDEDCSVCGWYVDGVKTEKLECYTFDKLQLVLPYNMDWSGHDQINLCFTHENNDKTWFYGIKSLPGSAIKSLVKGNYIVYTLFSKELGHYTQGLSLRLGQEHGFKRESLAYGGKSTFGKKDGPSPDCKIIVYAESGTLTGYTESYDENCKCIKKRPNYSYASLSKEYALTCTNRIGKGLLSKDELDLSQPCSASGEKVDLNKLGGGSSNNGSGNVTINNTVVVKNEVSTSTKTTNGTTST
jgi:hypothetical protein